MAGIFHSWPKDHVVKADHQTPNYLTPAILLSILLLGLLLRLNGLDWGMPNGLHPDYSYHPDEIYLLSWAMMMQHGDIIPNNFVYGGTFYFSTLQLINWLGAFLTEQFGGQLLFNTILVGRTFGLIYALLTIYLVYATGRTLFSPATGLLAALVLAVLPAHVFWAQRVRPDELFALEFAANFLIMARILKKQRTLSTNLVLGGLLLGVTVATRFPALVLYFGYAVAIGLILNNDFKRDRPKTLKKATFHLLIIAGTSCLGYLGASPYTVLYYQEFVSGLQIQWHFQSGVFLDAVNRGPNWFQYGGRILIQAVGYPFYGLMLAAVIYSLWKRRAENLLLLAVILPYFLLLSKTSWVVTRYTLPLLPGLAILVVSMLRDLATKKQILKIFAIGAIVVAVFWAVALDLAYSNVLRGPDPRDTATVWITENVEPDATIGAFKCYDGDDFTNPPQTWRQKWCYFNMHREDIDQFLSLPFDYIVVNEDILSNTKRLGTQHPSLLPYNKLHIWSNRPSGYTLINTFSNNVSITGLDMGSYFTSIDYMIARPTISIYKRDSLETEK